MPVLLTLEVKCLFIGKLLFGGYAQGTIPGSCIQGSLLMLLRGPYMVLKSDPEVIHCYGRQSQLSLEWIKGSKEKKRRSHSGKSSFTFLRRYRCKKMQTKELSGM